ncbi:MAG: hypothetical protein JWO82_2037 [Akkermansiaceae bacterium]|nr:hypothetical protein [Akkermansiaceae bacterium]
MTGKALPATLAIAAACLFLGTGAFAGDTLSEEAKGAEQMKSLLKLKPELAVAAPQVEAKDNALEALLLWMEKEYPLVRDDIPAPILSGIETWKGPAIIEFLEKQHERLDELNAIAAMRDSSALAIPLERIRKLRPEDVLQVRNWLVSFTFTLFRGGEQERSVIPVLTLLGISRILGEADAVSPECQRMSLEVKGAAVGAIQVLLDKEKVPFHRDTLRVMEQMMQTPRWPEPLADVIKRYWSYHTYRLVLPSCRGTWLDLAVPEYVLDHPKAGTTALTSCAAAWLSQTEKLDLAAYNKPLPVPAWEAPAGLPEEARLWVTDQYQSMADVGKGVAAAQAWMHLVRAALLDALGTPDAKDDDGVKISFKTVDGRRVACLPDDMPSPSGPDSMPGLFRSVPVPAAER